MMKVQTSDAHDAVIQVVHRVDGGEETHLRRVGLSSHDDAACEVQVELDLMEQLGVPTGDATVTVTGPNPQPYIDALRASLS